ncbi:MAG: signal transduction histidine kinase [Gammaproteobacteria bacterium]|jgi:signal transduction histidine kinase
MCSGKKGLDYLERMRSSASRMQKLIEDLLSYSRVVSDGKAFASSDLNRILAHVLDDLEMRVQREGGKVTVSELPVIEGDHTQMRQLLQNLIGNALKFHPDNRAPIVNINAEVLDAADASGEMSKRIAISVEDNGIGFEEQYADKIFAPFQRLHGRGEYEGTGIGLAVCKKIVERHNGEISVHSELGVGTTFRVVLPISQPADDIAILESVSS